ncbi:FG-nucleoporin nsp1 [Paecilomyces lecythidis]|uniref:FG-nucleoporin nsp1 n=1 Tax=Paecilomyces lecythidis TaxID=3004212 RepID=A0ABR3XZA5_9EURO
MSNPSFSFGTPASSGASSGGLFGTSGGSALFGSNTQSGSGTGSSGGLFGNVGASTSGTSSPSLFGTATSGAGQSTPLFGGGSAGGSTTPTFSFGKQNQPSSTTQSTTPQFGGASLTPKTSESSATGQTSTSNLFGGAPKTSGGLFGSTTATPTTSGGLFGNNNNTNTSTTPAGPPPLGSSTGQGQSLFGGAAQKPASSGLFGNLNTSTPSSTPATTTTAATPATTQSQQTGGLFGGNAASKPLFGSTPSTGATAGGLFGNLNKDKPAETPATGSAGTGAKPLFGTTPGTAGGATPSTQAAASPFKFPGGSTDSQTTPKPTFSLGGTNTSQPSSTPATSTATPQKSLFPSLGGATSSATPSSTSATDNAATATSGGAAAAKPAASTGGLFSLGKPAETTTAASQPATTTTASATGTTTSTTTAGPAAAGTTATTGIAGTTAGAPAFGASTAGPAPPAQSRLKNKTMDEIITRWATDLTKYQKEFREQAEKVAEWDRMLVENGTKVQKLYGSTVDAERATQEVERQLASVEGQQEELSSWLDRYEREVDEMMSKQVGPGETLQGPDQERERTYKLAEKLSERLDEMGKDLGSMIEEVNGATSTLSKTNKADEPISQIVRILNSHLSQLQMIDQGTAELQAKVSAAQKAGQSLGSRLSVGGYGGYGSSSIGGGSSAAEDFYRSYMGRR